MNSPAKSIDEILDRLSAIIDWSITNDSRLGYFPALYRKVTLNVRDGIGGNTFADNARQERFTVIFANRYLDAFAAWSAGKPISLSWRIAFESSTDYWPIVLQHLLLGMNAHINLDLGIAAAETMRGGNIEDLRPDFNTINRILGSLVNDVQNQLAEVWMTLGLLNRFLGTKDDSIVNFSMQRARDEAWRSAVSLSSEPEPSLPDAIAMQDKKTRLIGNLVRNPGLFLGLATKAVRVGEVQSPREVIRILKS